MPANNWPFSTSTPVPVNRTSSIAVVLFPSALAREMDKGTKAGAPHRIEFRTTFAKSFSVSVSPAMLQSRAMVSAQSQPVANTAQQT